MANVQNQSPRVTSGFLNTVNDPAPGVALASPSGTIIQPYGGQVGGDTYLSATDALKLSDVTNTGTLYEGIYKYVQFLISSTATAVRGQPLFWYNRSSYIVTPDVTAATIGKLAGICLNVVTKGNYAFIQIAGRASVVFKAALTTPGDGQLIVVDPTPTATAVNINTADTVTPAVLKSIIGIADGLPASSAISQVDLTRAFDQNW